MFYHKSRYVEIYHADCREVIPRIDDKTVQVVITSGSLIRPATLPLDYNMQVLNLLRKPLIDRGVVFWHVISDPKEFTDAAEKDGWVLADVINCGIEWVVAFAKQEDHIWAGEKNLVWEFPEDRTLNVCSNCGKPSVETKLPCECGCYRFITFPGVFPERMVERCLDLVTEYFKFGVILDPFCGSGTVGVVGKKRLWRTILIDKDELACEMSRLRTEAV